MTDDLPAPDPDWYAPRIAVSVTPLDPADYERLLVLLAELEDHYIDSAVEQLSDSEFEAKLAHFVTAVSASTDRHDFGEYGEPVSRFLNGFVELYRTRLIRNSAPDNAFRDPATFFRASQLSILARAVHELLTGQLRVFTSAKDGLVHWIS